MASQCTLDLAACNIVEKSMTEKRKKRQKNEKSPKKPRTGPKKKPGFDENIYRETEYFVKNGLRYVKPYFFTFTTYCKGRWLRRKLINVLAEEFQAETIDYYSRAIKNGNIKVNGNMAAEDTILKDNDIITHKVHRHEPPVTAETIQIIEESDDIIVVNKPSSIPIHPCGRYRHNSLVFLLGREFGMTNLYTIHRIDRLTSGIVMFAKSLEKAQELEKQLREREMHKEYVCKVRGEFPSGVVECSQPISVVSHKVGVCRVELGGKPCRTVFTREHYDGRNSIVKCQPFTGRMHQIRVHLQWLGHPIVDDPIYNHEAWGPDRGSGGVDDEKAWKVIESIATSLRSNDPGIESTNTRENVDLKTGISQTPSVTCDIVEQCNETTPEANSDQRNETKSCVATRPGLNSGVVGNLDKKTRSYSGKASEENPVEIELSSKDITLSCGTTCQEPKLDLVVDSEIQTGTSGPYSERNESQLKNPSLTPDEQTRDKNLAVSQPVSSAATCGEEKPKEQAELGRETRNCDERTMEKCPDCTECRIQRRDPSSEELKMCLHAAVYKGPGWEFRCPWPAWALPQMETC